MDYSKYLKRKFRGYIVSGVVLGFSIFVLIMLNRYNDHLSLLLTEAQSMNLNQMKMKKQIKDIDAAVEYFKTEFNIDIAHKNPELHIFKALDEMKENLGNAKIKVSGVEHFGGDAPIPVEIEVPVENYPALVNSMRYVESFKLPKFKISNYAVIQSLTGGTILQIKGSFVMPSL